ncbi:hydroxyacid dehydrogenase [Candidatus Parcubacteria bacterium]|nr:hydroxyacid dehydrogenase [Candidatus Parcubacteria bacterium]
MKKIVVTNNQNFTPDQKQRLDSLGDVTYYDALPEGAEEYLDRVKGADIICSGTAGLKDAYAELREVYITVGFVSVAFVDLDVLAENNVKISNAPGINQHAVSEWIMWMIILAMRRFDEVLNCEKTLRIDGSVPPTQKGLADRNITILGNGNVGKRVGKLAQAFDMNVSFFKRGDNLYDSVKDANIVVDTLSDNPSTHKLLDQKFFSAMNKGGSFISVTRSDILDEDALLKALNEGNLDRAFLDCGSILVGDTDDPYYQKLLKHPRVFVTPHIAYSSEMSSKLGNDVMIDNVEAWIKGIPQNILN